MTANIGWQDPRCDRGDLLWPARFDRDTLTALKRSLGAYAAAGQLQQQPVPEGGGMCRREWFAVLEAAPTDVVARCRFWDCAATRDGGDWTVGTKIARTRRGPYVVEHVVRGQWSPGGVDRLVPQTGEGDG